MNDWFLKQDGEVSGEFAFDDLLYLARRGGVRHDDWLRRGNSGAWIAAGQVEGLFQARAKAENRTGLDQLDNATQPANPIGIAQPGSPSTAPPPLPTKPMTRDWTREKTAVGGLAGILLLLLLLAFFLFWPRGTTIPQIGDEQMALEASGATAGGNARGDGQGHADSATSGSGNRNDRGHDLQLRETPSGAEQEHGERSVPQDNRETTETANASETTEEPPPTSEALATFTVPSLAPAPSSSRGTGSEGEEGGGQEIERTIAGVKVKGSLALVCDISGSMASDFPILYEELRRKFPAHTPLILVPGCAFMPAGQSTPFRITETQPSVSGYAHILKGDRHVYLANNTTDAIIFGVKELHRRTVMFNNDLQDGGSLAALEALNELRKERNYTLSGRSLNCDAPEQLKLFIERSGGDFKVDPIGRSKGAAVSWGP